MRATSVGNKDSKPAYAGSNPLSASFMLIIPYGQDKSWEINTFMEKIMFIQIMRDSKHVLRVWLMSRYVDPMGQDNPMDPKSMGQRASVVL